MQLEESRNRDMYSPLGQITQRLVFEKNQGAAIDYEPKSHQKSYSKQYGHH